MSDGSRVPTKPAGPGRYVMIAAAVTALLLGALALIGFSLDEDTREVRVDLSEVPCDGLLRLVQNPGEDTPELADEASQEYADRCVTNGSAGVASNAGPGFYGNGNCDRYCLMAFLAMRSGVML